MTALEFIVLLYDRERYFGEKRDPQYRLGDVRFFLNAYVREEGKLFHSLAWTASATSYEQALGMVPLGGTYFDRSTNFPSPMGPIEGWKYNVKLPGPGAAESQVTNA